MLTCLKTGSHAQIWTDTLSKTVAAVERSVPGFRKARNAGLAAFNNKMSTGTPSDFRLNWNLKAAESEDSGSNHEANDSTAASLPPQTGNTRRDGLTVRPTPSDSPCWSGSAFLDTMALMAGKVMLDMAATAPAAHIILGRKRQRSGSLCQGQGAATEGTNLPTPGDRRGQTLTRAAIRSRTRRAAGSGSPVPTGWCFCFLSNA